MIIKIALSPNFGEFIVPDIFDGTLDDVSMFIGLFKTESVKHYRRNKDFERAHYEGQTSHDLFHS